jgi:hypothetical protein
LIIPFAFFLEYTFHTLGLGPLPPEPISLITFLSLFCYSYITGYKSELWKQDLLFIFPFKNASYLLTLHRNLMIECWKVFKSPRFGIKVSFAMMEGGSYIAF